MSMFGGGWLEEGFYSYEEYDGYTRVDDPDKIRELHQEGNLFEHDGMGMGKVETHDIIDLKRRKYKGE